MMITIAIQAAIVALLAGVDAVRIRAIWGRKPNINHYVSWGLAVAACIAQWLILHADWHWWLFAIMCAACRLLLYDLLLNIFRREKLDYVSSKTSSYQDQHSEKVGFWVKRGIGAAMLIVVFIIQLLIK